MVITMPPKTEYIWMDGKLKKYEDATVHVLSQGIHYGMGIFEGIRCYKTSKGCAIFRLNEHVLRFFNSAKIIGLEVKSSPEELSKAIVEVIKMNKLSECYIRPFAFGGNGGFDLTSRGVPTHLVVAVWPWNNYLNPGGIKLRTSSYTRIPINACMTKAKVSGNYVNSILAKQEAIDAGADEGLMLDQTGSVSEATSENVFIVKNNQVITPPKNTILEGITRESVIELLSDLNIKITEQQISRDQLYTADEIFLSGTAAEIIAVNEYDKRIIGNGKMGPVTQKLKDAFSEVVLGKNKKYEHWLTYVD